MYINSIQHKRLVKIFTKEFLLKEYIDKGRSAYSLAKQYNCQFSTVGDYLNRFEIPIRKTTRIDDILTKEFLIKNYIDLKKTTTEIARMINTSHSVVQSHMKKKGVPIRSQSEAQIGVSAGNKHWNWCGGYDRNGHSTYFKSIRDDIRQREDYCCALCGLTNDEHLNIFKNQLNIHHVDYDKNNDLKTNLISLCKICHLKANANKDYWFAYYSWILHNEIYKEKKNAKH